MAFCSTGERFVVGGFRLCHRHSAILVPESCACDESTLLSLLAAFIARQSLPSRTMLVLFDVVSLFTRVQADLVAFQGDGCLLIAVWLLLPYCQILSFSTTNGHVTPGTGTLQGVTMFCSSQLTLFSSQGQVVTLQSMVYLNLIQLFFFQDRALETCKQG